MPLICSACSHDNPDDGRFCQKCGSPLSAADRSTKYDKHDAQFRDPYTRGDYQEYDSYQAPPSATPVLVWSILATVFCCQITGIVAIVFAALAMSAIGERNYVRAQRQIQTAKTWAWISFGLGLVAALIYGVIGFMNASGGIP